MPTASSRPLVALTERQQEALEIIRAFITKNGYPPTVRDLARRLGITSTNAVAGLLASLERKGWLTRVPGVSRGMRLRAQEDVAAGSAPESKP